MKIKHNSQLSPQDFWQLAGSLKSDVKLSDKQLKAARQKFSRAWGKNDK